MYRKNYCIKYFIFKYNYIYFIKLIIIIFMGFQNLLNKISTFVKQTNIVYKYIKNNPYLNKLNIFISFTIVSVILSFNIQFGNFLNLPMIPFKQTYNQKTENAKLYNKISENLLLRTGTELRNIIKDEECNFALVMIEWEKGGIEPLLELKANYLYIKTVKNGELIDVKHLMKDKGMLPNKHDTKTSIYNIKNHFKNGSGMYQETDKYEEISAGAVKNMFDNYYFLPYGRAGATYVSDRDENKAVRFLIMMDKECANKIKSHEAVRLVENLRDDHAYILSK